jgi:anti-sigma regulatory factor (Ser/Thr protein kinase)
MAATLPSRLTIANTSAGIVEVGRWVEALAAELRLSSDTAFAVRLCLEEAVANIVEHGFDSGAAADIGLSVERDDGRLRFEIVDAGRPFDPLAAPPPAAVERLEDAPEGGRGIALMRAFADHVGYERRAGRNLLRLGFTEKTPSR